LIDNLAQQGLPPPLYLPCDLKDIPALQAAIAEAPAGSAITVLVNNAANDQRHAYEDVTVEFWMSGWRPTCAISSSPSRRSRR